MKSATPSRSVFSRVGPGIISACVVIGPGSVLTSTKVGAEFGFQLIWVLLLAVILMVVYMAMGARLGAIANEPPGAIVTRKAGRWLAVAIGISVFCISSAYQFGNSLGVHAAVVQFVPGTAEAEMADDASLTGDTAQQRQPRYTALSIAILVAFNLLAIGFLFAFADLYRWLERLMMVFVGLMLAAFLINLYFAKPDLAAMARGLVPSVPAGSDNGSDWVPVIGWIGTTFITAVAYYQAYLVRQKGWGATELKQGLVDARIGSMILALITLMIMATAASVFHQVTIIPQDVADSEFHEVEPKNIIPKNVADVGQQLRPFFGTWGQVIFCVGLFSAAYSSFVVNSMIGGFLLSDGFNLGSDPHKTAPRVCAAAIMVIGMTIALVVITFDFDPVPAIVLAQAVTVLAAPLIGAVLWWLTSCRDVMGDKRNGIVTHVMAAAGVIVLVVLSIHLLVNKLIPNVNQLLGQA